jgi:uncharacterized protein (DUF169 family)
MKAAIDAHSSYYSLLERATDTHWTCVEFLPHRPANPGGVPPEAMRFCEAVHQAACGRIDLMPETICCEGARRAFGWMKNRNETLVQHLSEKMGVSGDRARELVERVPVLAAPCAGVRVGDCTHADVLVTYVRPEAAMRLVRFWETATGRSLHVDISSIMAVCGNAVVKAYTSQSISISFGCPDSRQYGGIQPEEMVIAVPAGLVARLAGITNVETTPASR